MFSLKGPKGFISRLADYSGEKMSDVKGFFFGGNTDNDSVELNAFHHEPKHTRHSTNQNKNNPLIPEDLSSNAEEYEGIDCSRNLVVTSTTLFRKGPIPIEHLSHREQNRLSERGCLQEWDDSRQATSDNHLAFIDPSSKSLLTYFARMGSGEDDTDIVNLAFVDSLIRGGASWNYPDVHGQSIFFAVVRDWHIDVAYFAIDRGADVNHRDKFGRTPLHLAAAVNYAEMVEFLIDQGADIMVKTHGEEQTPLHYAARYDSVEAIKVLIQSGAMIDGVDFLNRTPLHVAAETGSHEAVKFLMKLGAPTGVYDYHGNSAMFMMIEKMPYLAYEGLNQFFVEDNAMRRRYYYLDHLEFDVKSKGTSKDARTVLEAIVMYDEVDLIMHPAVQKLLDVKWKLFGKRHAIVSNFWNIFYTILATLLTFSIPFYTYDQQYSPVKDNVWKIVLAVIFFILTFYFWIKQILRIKRLNHRDAAYKEHRLDYIKKQIPYCHPRWKEERGFLDKEVTRIEKYKSTFWRDPWNIFEWISLFFILVKFALHIGNIISPDKEVFRAAKFISAISLILVWFRLYKTLRIVSLIAEVNVLLKHVIIETSRFFILFIDFYIPYIFVFFMLFGGPASSDNITKRRAVDSAFPLETIADVAYYVWLLTIDQRFPDMKGEKEIIVARELFLGSYIVIVTVLLVFLYIGRISEAFSRLYKKSSANANLLSAGILLTEEKDLPMKEKRALKKHMRRFCGPMVVPFESSQQGEDDDQNINIGIDHVTTKIEDITNYLRKAQFPKQEKQPINIEHLTVFQTELEKLSQRQVDIEKETNAMKSKINASQKNTIEMIKETIELRSGKNVHRRNRQLLDPDKKNSGYVSD